MEPKSVTGGGGGGGERLDGTSMRYPADQIYQAVVQSLYDNFGENRRGRPIGGNISTWFNVTLG